MITVFKLYEVKINNVDLPMKTIAGKHGIKKKNNL